MQNKLVNILRIFFVLTLLVLGGLVLCQPSHTETNILKAIFSTNEDNLLVDLSTRFSSKINVIVESDDYDEAETIAKTFYAKLDKTKMHSSNINATGIIEDYEKYQNNLLSNKTRKLLTNKDYDAVIANAYESLYNPVMPPIGSIEQDPFLLLTDFVMNLTENFQTSADFVPIQLNDKFYSLIILDVDNELALSPTVLNAEVKKLVDLQNELSKDGVKVYLTGAPVHSYFASSHSIFEINLICILSTLFVIGLIFWYFGSLLPLIPIAVSIGLGIYAGYCVTALIFKDIHILTFVFSTTLIGVCVDYSLHYFVALKEGKSGVDTIKDIFKSLTVSLITTVSAFLILLFADFVLLRQISVFTITGLVTVYGVVVLGYPMIKGFLDAKMPRGIEAKSVSVVIPSLIRRVRSGCRKLCGLQDFSATTKTRLTRMRILSGIQSINNQIKLQGKRNNSTKTDHASSHLRIFASKYLAAKTLHKCMKYEPMLLQRATCVALLLSCLVTVLLIFGLFRTHFDDNIKNMYAPPKNLLNAEKLLTEIVGTSADTSIFVVKGENLQDILQKEEKIADKLNNENSRGYQALSKFVPSEKRQKSNQILRKELYNAKLYEYAGFLPTQTRLRLINANFGNEFLSVNKDFEFLKKNFLIDGNTSIMVVSGYKGQAIEGVKIINFQKDISSQIRHCRKICLALLVPIFGLLYLLLAKIYDFKSAVKILAPSVCAVVFVFTILGLFGCAINLFHLLAIFLIIGFGLDYSVFRLTNPEKSGDSILLSCVTTVFSFALLAFAGFKLISSLGTVLALGLLSSYIFSIKLISRGCTNCDAETKLKGNQ